MERNLLWSALALSLAGLLYACLSLRTRRPVAGQVLGPFAVLAFALPALVFVATLPSRSPWSANQGFGRGFALGAVAGMVAAWLAARAASADRTQADSVRALAGAQFAAVAAIGLPTLAMHGVVVDAICAAAIGWVCIAILATMAAARRREEGASASDIALTQMACFFAVALASAVLVGVHRDALSAATVRGPWAALALFVGAAVPLLTLLAGHPASLLARGASRVPGAGWLGSRLGRLGSSTETEQILGRAAQVLVAGLLLSGLVWLLASRLVGHPTPLHAAIVGLAAGVVAWWIIADPSAAQEQSAAGAWPAGGAPPLAFLALVGGFIVASQMLQGVGVGVLVLASSLPLGLAVVAYAGRPESDGVPPNRVTGLVQAMGFATLLVIFRAFMARYAGDLRGVSLTDSYALFGFLSGALLPSALAELLVPARRAGEMPVSASVARVVVVGALTVAAPGAVVLLWGAKCALAMVAGIALGALTRNGPAGQRGAVGAAGLLGVAAALALVQWTGRVLPLAEMSRQDKVRLLAWVVGGIVVLVLASDYGPRALGRIRTRRQKAEAR